MILSQRKGMCTMRSHLHILQKIFASIKKIPIKKLLKYKYIFQ